MAHLCHYLVRAGSAVINALEDLLDAIADDTLVQRGLEADLGLKQGALDRVKDKDKAKRPPLTGIDDYIDDVDADAEKLAVAIDSIKAYAKFWTTCSTRRRRRTRTIVVEEALYRLFEYATVDLMKFEHPNAYAWMRLLRVFVLRRAHRVRGDVRARGPRRASSAASTGRRRSRATSTSGSTRRPTSSAATRTPRRPDDAHRACASSASASSASPTSLRRRRAGLPLLVALQGPRRRRSTRSTAGRSPRRPQPPPCLPPPDDHRHPAARPHRQPRLRRRSSDWRDGDARRRSRSCCSRTPTAGSAGCSRSAATISFDEKAGSAERPVKITVKVEAKDGLDALLPFSRRRPPLHRGDGPGGSMSVAIAPAQPATAGPGVRAARLDRHAARDRRLLVQGRDRRGRLQARGVDEEERVRDRDRRGRRVREGVGRQEGDAGRVRLRPDRDAGRGLDRRRRAALDHDLAQQGVGGLTVQTLQLRSQPDGEAARVGAALRGARRASTSTLGPLHFTVEQIGATLDLGSSRDGVAARREGADPVAALRARPRLPAAERARHPHRERLRQRRRLPLLRPRQRGVRGRAAARLRRASPSRRSGC